MSNAFKRELGRANAKIKEYEEFIGHLPCQSPMTCRVPHLCLACKLHKEEEYNV